MSPAQEKGSAVNAYNTTGKWGNSLPVISMIKTKGHTTGQLDSLLKQGADRNFPDIPDRQLQAATGIW